MTAFDRKMRCLRPDVREARDGRHLFVWGDVGQWLAVDGEAAALLDDLFAEQTVADGLLRHARSNGERVEVLAAKTEPVINELRTRGIVTASSEIAPPTEPLSIASLTYNITNRCNLDCSWCYNPRACGREVDPGDVVRWIADGRTALGRDATFIILGGEPFLDQPRLLRTLHGARGVFDKEILVSTNGTLLDPDSPEELNKARVTVQVSLDAARADPHDAIRGRGVFERAAANTRRLVDAGVHTVLSMVMTRGGETGFEAYFDLAEQLGAAEVRFIPLRQIGGGAKDLSRAPDLFAAFQQLVELLRRRPKLRNRLRRDFFSILMSACRYSHLRDNCGIGRRCLFVDADGAIYPCPNHRGTAFRCGEIKTRALTNLVRESEVLAEMRRLYRVSRMYECRSCAYRFWCAGDCRAEALLAGGSPHAPSPHCEALKKIMKEMLWLTADGWQSLASSDPTAAPWT